MRFLIILFLPLIFNSCGFSPKEVKFNKYRISGERLYEKHCANCHQTDGKGLRGLYPPISDSDYLNGHLIDVICGIKYGSNDSLVVNGVKYIIPMPASGLSNLEIAQITTYIYNEWDESIGLVDVRRVEKLIKECEDRY